MKSALINLNLSSLAANYNKLSSYKRRTLRLKYVEAQNNKCYFCGEPLNKPPASQIRNLKINWKLFPPNFLRYPIHLHHSHESGMTIGAVHAY